MGTVGVGALCEIGFVGMAYLTNAVLATVLPIDSTRIRIRFSRAMLNNAALTNKENYVIEPTSPNYIQININSIEVESTSYPTWIDLVTSEHTNGGDYELTIASINGPTDPSFMPVDSAIMPLEYIGIGVPPVVLYAKANSRNLVEVKFSETMLDNARLRDHTEYTFDNGLVALEIVSVVGSVVLIRTTDQVPDTLYTLMLTPPAP